MVPTNFIIASLMGIFFHTLCPTSIVTPIPDFQVTASIITLLITASTVTSTSLSLQPHSLLSLSSTATIIAFLIAANIVTRASCTLWPHSFLSLTITATATATAT
eukprot:Gb_23169 [translate_table: standard]